MFRTLAIAASGLSAQRQRVETIATNIANAETTHTEAGGPYRRRVVVLESTTIPGQPYELGPDGTPAPFRLPSGDPLETMEGVRVAAIEEDNSEGPLVYDPGHPDADAAGYVRYPNVRVTDEMVDLMSARRIYEANATMFQSAKSMLRAAINL
jgi:flagellar basal-body rod protein FlgC